VLRSVALPADAPPRFQKYRSDSSYCRSVGASSTAGDWSQQASSDLNQLIVESLCATHNPGHAELMVDRTKQSLHLVMTSAPWRRPYWIALLALVLLGLTWQLLLMSSSRTSFSPMPEESSTDTSLPKEFTPSSLTSALPSFQSSPSANESQFTSSSAHPIDRLIERADKAFDEILNKQTHSLEGAADAYRKARGRHPPPGFDAWFKFAQERDAVIIEEFWDQIYEDLGPFWAVLPRQIRADARAFNMVVNVHNGSAKANTDWFWHVIWAELIDTIAQHLPDMTLPLNPMDEPRLFVPWEDITAKMQVEKKRRRIPPTKEVSSNVGGWSKDDGAEEGPATDLDWHDTTPYSLVRQACPPDSALRNAQSISDPFRDQKAPDFALSHMYGGYVSNYSLSTVICHQPDLCGLHGALMQPISTSSSQQLYPLFGGSKFTVNNEILLPAPMYWNEEERFTGGPDPGTVWQDKRNAAVWRGTATGGRNTAMNWKHFHRHRFLAMTNSTKYRAADKHDNEVFTSWLRKDSLQALQPSVQKHFSDWLNGCIDFGFTDLMCDGARVNGTCWYTDHDFSVLPTIHMSRQFDYKYLPDIDGNSFSGRYRAFVMSTSLPIKATIYREWHDSRLVAWKHFAPMDNGFGDFYGIIEYFLGLEGVEKGEAVAGHDAAAESIALAGKEWAEKVLRKEDMQVYVLRLLLEYARICDDNREMLGFAGDLNGKDWH
jgi:Glycosyl transferase family 90